MDRFVVILHPEIVKQNAGLKTNPLAPIPKLEPQGHLLADFGNEKEARIFRQDWLDTARKNGTKVLDHHVHVFDHQHPTAWPSDTDD